MGYPFKKLEEVVSIYDGRRTDVQGTHRPSREGPYRLYVENAAVPFDDFAFDGTYLLLGTVGNVVAQNRCLNVVCATGKFAVGEAYHVVACDGVDDTLYLRRVLTHTPIFGYAEVTGESNRLSEANLRLIDVPWPDSDIRRAFVRYMDDAEALEKESTASAREIFYQAVDDYEGRCAQTLRIGELCDIHEGRFLGKADRADEGRLPVVCSQGIVGRTDEEGVEGPCVAVVQSGSHLLARRMSDGVFPLRDAAALTLKEDAPANFSVEELTLALAAAGVHPRTHLVGGRVDAPGLKLDRLADVEVGVPSPEASDSARKDARAALLRVDALEEQASRAQRDANVMAHDLIKGCDDVEDRLSAWMMAGNEGTEASEDEANAGLKGVTEPCAAVPSVQVKTSDRLQDSLEEAVAQARADVDAQEGEQTPSFDAAWEVMPLLFLRCLPGGEVWGRVKEASDPSAQADEELLRLAGLTPVLSSLVNLTSQSSVLSPQARAGVMRELDALPIDDLGSRRGDPLRWLALEHDTDLRKKAGKEEERRIDAPCPSCLADLISQVVEAFCPGASSAFDPCARGGEVLAACHRRLPAATCHAQTGRFSDALAAVMAAFCEGWEFAEGAPQVAESLIKDCFHGETFDAVVSVLPFNQGQWCPGRLDADDERWVFGVPPRSKANFAWLQHAYAHRAQGGVAVLAVGNAALYGSRGGEPAIREKLVDSGCVQAIISLPGGLFDDGRGPMSLVVLGDAREGDAPTLFMNALECGSPLVPKFWPPERSISSEAGERIMLLIRKWAQSEECDAEPGFAREVPKSEVIAHGELTPWSFV